MFDPNSPAYPRPSVEWRDGQIDGPEPGLTIYQGAVLRFTAAWIGALAHHAECFTWDEMNKKASGLGILAADEYVSQMKEREQ